MNPPGLPLRYRVVILALVVVQFFFGAGAVWRKPFDWDRSILYSYATIPVLVLGALLLTRRLRFGPWVIHTVEITCVKFLITASFLVGWLLYTGASPPRPFGPSPQPPPAAAAPAQRPPPTPIAPESTGEIVGTVTDPTGAPVAGVLAYIASGLEGVVFASPSEPLVIENDGARFLPAIAGVQVDQPLLLRSTDRRLHTLLAAHRDRSWIRNAPIPGSGEGQRIALHEAAGIITLRCTVHESREAPGYLGVFAHPFFAVTGPDGRFAFRAVPAGQLSIAGFHPSRGEASGPVLLEAGKQASVALTLP
jgi:hypothetical protein